MRHLASIPLVLLMTGLWVALNERIDVPSVGVGFAIAVATIIVTNRLVLKEGYREKYRLRPLRAVLYFLRLLWQIYAAGFEAVARMVTGRINVGIVDIETELENDFAVCLLANSITLTPGTVTLDRSGQTLKIIWLTAETRDPDTAGRAIKGRFEELLKEVVPAEGRSS